MYFDLNKEQQDIKKAAREFAEGEFTDIAEDCDLNEEFPKAVWKKACELGFIGGFIEEQYGGSGLGVLENALILEEFWRIDPGCGNIALSAYGAELIHLYGTEEQKQKYLPPLTKGEAIMGIAYTEPDSGSDIASMTTSAVKEGDAYVINGKKTFITNGTIAEYLVVICVTNPEAASAFNRYAAIIVETNREGFSAKAIKDKLSLRASDFAEIIFKDVRVPQKNLIKQEGTGYSQLLDFLDWARMYTAAQGVGIAQGAFEKSVQYLKDREQFGHPIGYFQINQTKVAELSTMIEAARGLCYRAAATIDQGKADRKLISMAKLLAAKVAEDVTGEAMHIHGGIGFTTELNIERLYRDSRTVAICAGTNANMNRIIAKSFLGNLVEQ